MTADFHRRFDIKVGLDEAKKRFVNRCFNLIFENYDVLNADDFTFDLKKAVATELGKKHYPNDSFSDFIKDDFHSTLLAIEAIYQRAIAPPRGDPRSVFPAVRYESMARHLNKTVPALLVLAEVDLSIKWEKGRFFPTGAALLDEALVNDSLRWLREKKIESVLTPFEKGLRHFLHAQARQELLGDVITDMYEAFEALACEVTGRHGKDLSQNKELFLSKVSLGTEYKELLTAYIDFAQNFRHSRSGGKKKPEITPAEAESFMYLTGTFIRASIAPNL